MCSYHGWQFDEQGICTHIPQAENPELASKNKESLCAVALPIRQQQDLLWIWPDAKSSEVALEIMPDHVHLLMDAHLIWLQTRLCLG